MRLRDAGVEATKLNLAHDAWRGIAQTTFCDANAKSFRSIDRVARFLGVVWLSTPKPAHNDTDISDQPVYDD